MFQHSVATSASAEENENAPKGERHTQKKSATKEYPVPLGQSRTRSHPIMPKRAAILFFVDNIRENVAIHGSVMGMAHSLAPSAFTTKRPP